LLVEGESDYNFFSHQIGDETANIVISDGCENVVEEIKTIEKDEKMRDSLGIIDRDYRLPLGKVPDSNNIVMTDLRDLETMMFATHDLMNILSYGLQCYQEYKANLVRESAEFKGVQGEPCTRNCGV
jgi:hypothetical protein